jgi:acyl carrier protein
VITEADVRSALQKTLKDQGVQDWELTFDFREDALDSLDHATFALLLDERHGLTISDADLDRLNTIQAVLDYVAEKNG